MLQIILFIKSSAVILFFAFLFSCNSSKTNPRAADLMSPPSDSMKEAMIKNNRQEMQIESAEIDAFAKKRNWNMNTTGTGLRYEIYYHGTGNVFPKKEDFATVAYSLYLIDGTLISKVTADKPEIFQLSKTPVPHGLEEGVTYMKAGDKAHLLLPKHLGYGLVGDDKKIPYNSILYYDVELLSVK
jgi:FKBP-type peptidyl-prolyl cis-trans isomerase